MNTHFQLKNLFRVALGHGLLMLGLCLPVYAVDTFELASGDVVAGTVLLSNGESVVLALAEGGARTVNLNELSAEAASRLEDWKARNPALSNVHVSFDQPPVPRRTVEPSRNRVTDGATGMISIGMVINEQGRVINAQVLRTQHEGLEAAALDAVRRWTFEPAQVGQTPVASYIVVPLRFN